MKLIFLINQINATYLSFDTVDNRMPTSFSRAKRFGACCPITGTLEAIATIDAIQHSRSARPASSCILSLSIVIISGYSKSVFQSRNSIYALMRVIAFAWRSFESVHLFLSNHDSVAGKPPTMMRHVWFSFFYLIFYIDSVRIVKTTCQGKL